MKVFIQPEDFKWNLCPLSKLWLQKYSAEGIYGQEDFCLHFVEIITIALRAHWSWLYLVKCKMSCNRFLTPTLLKCKQEKVVRTFFLWPITLSGEYILDRLLLWPRIQKPPNNLTLYKNLTRIIEIQKIRRALLWSRRQKR